MGRHFPQCGVWGCAGGEGQCGGAGERGEARTEMLPYTCSRLFIVSETRLSLSYTCRGGEGREAGQRLSPAVRDRLCTALGTAPYKERPILRCLLQLHVLLLERPLRFQKASGGNPPLLDNIVCDRSRRSVGITVLPASIAPAAARRAALAITATLAVTPALALAAAAALARFLTAAAQLIPAASWGTLRGGWSRSHAQFGRFLRDFTELRIGGGWRPIGGGGDADLRIKLVPASCVSRESSRMLRSRAGTCALAGHAPS